MYIYVYYCILYSVCCLLYSGLIVNINIYLSIPIEYRSIGLPKIDPLMHSRADNTHQVGTFYPGDSQHWISGRPGLGIVRA